MNRIIVFLLVCCSFQAGMAQTEGERTRGWQSDIDTLLSLMKSQHYIYKARPLPEKLLKQAARLKDSVTRFSDERMALELEKLMYHMHDGHSYVLPFATKRGPSHYLPVEFYIFSDGVYIIDASEAEKELIGCRVERINGIGIDTILNDMHAYVHQDNPQTVTWFAPTVMRFRGVYEMYGLPGSSGSVGLDLVDRSHAPIQRTIAFVPVATLQGIPKLIPSQLPGAPPPPLYLSDVRTNYWMKNFTDERMLYFQFNQVQNAANESLRDFSQRLDSTLSRARPRLFVVDVRHNNGGNKMLLRPLIDVIKKYEAENPAGKTIVITGRNTFSAAQVFISLLNKETKAVFAGEPSSSSPNFVGEEGNMFLLPWSGAIGNISNRYHENIPGDTRRWIEPELPVALSSTDYFENRDPVMDDLREKFAQ